MWKSSENLNVTEGEMLIQIECVYRDKVISGCSYFNKSDLQKAVEEILKVVDEREFPAVFCSRYGYEEV